MKRIRKENQQKVSDLICALAICAGAFLLAVNAYANPVLDHVSAGQVSVQQTPTTTTVNQASQRAIINWQSFNIGPNESTHFQQPAGGSSLNRINPSNGVSSIYGRLTATGQIILVNSAGFYFGPSAYVNVGGMIATTANLSDQDFLNGYYRFIQISPLAGTIVNQGQLIAADHGLIALMGNGVQNDGTIQANLGNVVLASGNAFTMSFAGNDLISFAVDEKATRGITNTGTLRANGGTIMVSAKAAVGVLDHVINMEGFAEAQSVSQKNGVIIFSGDKNTGVVRMAAKVKADKVDVTGYNILLDDASHIEASNNVTIFADHATVARGSIIATGANSLVETSAKQYLDVNQLRVQAANWLLDPADITIDASSDANITGASPFTATDTGSVLSVSTLLAALSSGNVIVQTLNDAFSGNGDIIINAAISYNSAFSLTLSAFRSITSTLSNAIINNAGSGAVILRADNTGTGTGTVSFTGTTPNITTAGSVNIYYNPTTFGTQDTIYTGGTTPTKYMLVNTTTKLQNINSFLSGNFALAKDLNMTGVTWTSITNFTGKLDGLNYTISNLSASNGVFSTIGSGGIASNFTIANAVISGTSTIGIVAGTNVGTIDHVTISSGSITGTGSHIGGLVGNNSGVITNVSSSANVTGVQRVGGLIGTNSGSLNGAGNSITLDPSVVVTTSSAGDYVGGFIGYNTGDISNISLTLTNTVGGATTDHVGGFLGYNSGSLTNIYSNVNVAGLQYTGGFIGENAAALDGASNNIVVDPNVKIFITSDVAGADEWIGGFIGYNTGNLSNFSLTLVTPFGNGSVDGVGGFLGYNSGSLTNIYSGSSIIGNIKVGGLIGHNVANLDGENNVLFVDPKVTITIGDLAGSDENVGGFIGYNTGNLSNLSISLLSPISSAGIDVIGGFVGYNSGTLTNIFSSVSVNGDAQLGGLVGKNDGIILQSISTGAVTGVSNIGGLVGTNAAGTLTNNFWDTVTSGKSSGYGANTGTVNGLYGGCFTGTCAIQPDANSSNSGAAVNLSALTTYTSRGWTADTVITATPSASTSRPTASWFIFDGQTRPLLLARYSTIITDAYQLQLIGSTPLASYTLANHIDLTNSFNNDKLPWGTNRGTTGSGFVPIMNFAGTFDGGNYTLLNLYIDRATTDDVGLFGSTTNAATIQNISLTRASITGQNNVGILVGNNAGTVSNSSATNMISSATDINSVIGAGTVGGLIGLNSGTLTNIYSHASVSVSNSIAGGLVGSNSNSISSSYSTGSVSGAGSVQGGLVGVDSSGTYSNNYWDTTTSGETFGLGDGTTPSGMTGMTTANMKTLSNFTGFGSYSNLDTITYPYLTSFNPTAPKQISGTSGIVSGTIRVLANNNFNLANNITDGSGNFNFVILNNLASAGTPLLFYSIAATKGNIYVVTPTGDLTGSSKLTMTTNALTIGADSGAMTVSNNDLYNIRSTITDTNILYSNSRATTLSASMRFISTADTTFNLVNNITTTNQSITLNGPVTITVPTNITLSAGTGVVSFGSSLSTTLPMTLTVSSTGGSDIAPTSLSMNANTGTFTLSSPRDILVNSAISLTGTSTLSLIAARHIYLNGDITGANGSLTLSAGTTSQSINSGSFASPSSTGVTANISLKNFTLSTGQWYQLNASLPSFAVSTSFTIPNASATSQFFRYLSGTGTTLDPYLASDIYGVQGIGSSTTLITKSITLNNNISASTTRTWNSNAGFIPIGSTYTGTFDGANYTISNVTIAGGNSSDNMALFNTIGSAATVKNLVLSNFTVSGRTRIGMLAGTNNGSVLNITTTGTNTVSSSASLSNTGNYQGGLIGYNAGSIDGATVNATLNSTNWNDYVGGLVGYNTNTATLANVTSTGNVSGRSYVGGLIGANFANLDGANAISIGSGITVTSTGGVNNSANYLGGLIGHNSGNLSNLSSDATVTAQSYTDRVGGLLGYNAATVVLSNVHSTGNVTGRSYVGGLIGENLAAIDGSSNIYVGSATVLSQSGATNNANYLGGFIGYNSGNLSNVYTNATVTSQGYTNRVGGLLGYNAATVVLSNVHSTGNVTGRSYVGGLIGENLAAIDGSSNIYIASGITVTGTSGATNNASYLGGLIGYNTGNLSNLSSNATVTSQGMTDGVGGFLGYNGASVVLSNVYSTGNVAGRGNLGGFIGENYGTINGNNTVYIGNSVVVTTTAASTNNGSNQGGFIGLNGGSLSNLYSTATVIGSNFITNVGGFIGNNAVSGVIDKAYSTGYIASGNTVGGFAGANAGTIQNSFWNTATSGRTAGISNNTGTMTNLYAGCFAAGGTCASATITNATNAGSGITPVDLTQQSTFTTNGSWTFNGSNWSIIQNQSYPYLSLVYTSVPRILSGTTTASGNATVALAVNSVATGSTVRTGNNGFYYMINANGVIADNAYLIVYLSGNATKGNTIAIAPTGGASLSGSQGPLNITASTVTLGPSNTYSQAFSNSILNTIKGALSDTDILFSVTGGDLTIGNATNVNISLLTPTSTTYTLDGNIATQTGSTGSLTFNGPINITAASPTLTTLSTGNIVIAGNVDGGGNALTLSTLGSTSSVSGIISNLSAFTKAGSGTLTLSGASTYTGTNTFSAGTVKINADNNLGIGGSITFTSATLQATGSFTLDSARTITTNTAATLNIDPTFTLTYGGVISGAGTLTKSGTGTLSLTGTNSSYTGQTIVSAGTLIASKLADGGTNSSIGAGTTTPAISMAASTTLQYIGSGDSSNRAISLTGSGVTLDASGSGSLTLSGGITGTAANLILTGTGAGTQSGVIATTTGTLTKNGTGTWTLSNAANTYTGQTNIANGTLSVSTLAAGGSPSSLGSTAAGTAILLGSSGSAATLSYTGGTVTFNRNITINGIGGGTIQATNGSASTLTLSGTIAIGANAITFDTTGAGPSNIITSAMSSSAGSSLTKIGSGTLTLNSAVTGSLTTTNVNGGTLKNGIANALMNNITNMNVGASGTYDINGFAQSLLSLNGSGIVTDSGAAALLTVNSAGTDTFSGVLSGTLQLTKAGAGTLTLSGINNSYAGATTISAGTLSVAKVANQNTNSSIGTGATTATITISGATGVLKYTGTGDTTNRLINLTASGGTIDASGSGTLTLGATTNSITSTNLGLVLTGTGNGIVSNAISLGSGTMTKTGSGTWTLSSTNSSYTGQTIINAGTLVVSKLANSGTNSSIGAGTTTPTISMAANTTLQYTGAGDSSNRVISLTGSGVTLDASGSGSLTLSGGITGTAANLILTGTGSATESGTIATTSGTLTKSGSGTWTLSGTNSSYTGQTIINAGTLVVSKLADSGTNSSIGAGTTTPTISMAANTTLQYTGSGDSSNRAISLTGSGVTLDTSGSGALTLSGGITGTAANLILTGTGSATESGAIETTSGTLTKSGSGTWLLSGTNTYTGTTTINAGTLRISGNSAIADTSAIVLANVVGAIFDVNNSTETVASLSGGGSNGGNVTLGSGTLTVGDSNNTNFAGSISGTNGNLVKSGTGTLTLSGGNSFTGATTINVGTLSIAHTDGLGTSGTHTSSVSVTNGAALNLSNVAITPAIALTLNGTGISSNGALTATGTSSYAGNITVNTASSINSASSLTLSGNISGSGDLSKGGSGMLTLSGSNSFTGATFINAGTLNLTSAQSLGNSGTHTSGVTVATSTTLQLSNVVLAPTVALTLNGASALLASGTSTWNGNITLASNTGIATTTGSDTLTLNGTINGAYALAVTGSGTTIFGNTIGNSTPLTSLSVAGPATINGNISTSGNQSFSSALTVAAHSTLTSSAGDITVHAIDSNNSTPKNVSLSAVNGAINLNGVIGGNFAVNNFTANNTSNSAGLTIAHNITAAGNVSLLSGGIVQETGGAVISGALLTTQSVGGTTLTNANTVTSFNAQNTTSGDINLINTANAFTITGITQSASSADVNITNTGALTTSGDITTVGGDVSLITLTPDTSERAITIDGDIYTSNGIVDGGTITLNAANNEDGSATTLFINGLLSTAPGSGGVINSDGGATITQAPITGHGDINLTSNAVAMDLVLDSIDFSTDTTLRYNRYITVSGAVTTSLGSHLTLQGDYDNNGVGGVYITGSIVSSGDLTIIGSNLNGLSGADANAGVQIANGASVSAAGNIAISSLVGDSNIDIYGNVTSTGSGNTITITPHGTGSINLGANLTTNNGTITLSSPVALTTNTTINSAGGAVNFNNAITTASTRSLAITAGAGAITLGGGVGTNGARLSSVALTGSALNLNGGTVYTTGTQTYTGPVTLGANTTLTGSAMSFTNTISGTGYSLSIAGPATFANTIGGSGARLSSVSVSGASNLNGGAVYTSGNQSYAAITMGANTLLDSSTGAINITGNITGARTLTLNNTDANSSISGVIGAITSLTKNGNGTLSITNANNSYAGITTVNAGTLSIANNLALGTGNVAINNASLRLVGTINAANAIAFTGTDNINVGSSDSATLSGILSGSSITLNKTGTGTLILTRANTYSGTTNVNAGTLNIRNNAALSTSSVNVNTATLSFTGTAISMANNIGFSGTSTLNTAAANATILSGILSGSSITLNKTGPGSLFLSGNNTFTGTVNASAGTLGLQSSTALGNSSSTLALTGTANLSLTNNTSLNIPNAISFANGTTLTENNANGNSILSGVITLAGTVNMNVAHATNDVLTLSGAIHGSGVTINKTGVGTLILSGNNDFTGTTNINLGAVNVASSNALGHSSATATVNAGATLNITGSGLSIAQAITLNNATIASNANNSISTLSLSGTNNINAGSNTLSIATISGTGITMNLIGGGTVNISGNNSYTGTTNVNNGTLSISGFASALGTSTVNVNNATLHLAESLGAINNTINLSNAFITSSNTNSLATVSLTGSNTITPAGSLTISSLSGSGSFNMTGSGALTIGGDNSTYSGVSTVTSGALRVAHNNALGSNTINLNGGTLQAFINNLTLSNAYNINNAAAIGGSNNMTLSGDATLNTGSALTINNSATTTLSGNLSGAGALIIAGNAIISGSNNSSYNGTTTLNSGNLQLGVATNALGTGAFILNGGSVQSNVSTATLNNTFTVADDASVIGANNIIFTGSGSMNNGTTLTIDNSGTTTFSGGLVGDGNIDTQNASALIISGNNTGYNGTITLNGGAFNINASTNLGTARFVANNNATIYLNAVSLISNAITLNDSTLDTVGAVSLGGNITLLADSSATIHVNSGSLFTMNGYIDGPGDLILQGAGHMNMNGEVGTIDELNSITGNLAVTFGGTVNHTIGDQEWNAPITMVADTQFISNNGQITFNSSAPINGNFPLVINAHTYIYLNSTIGAIMPASTITMISGQGIFLNGVIIRSTGIQSYTGPILSGTTIFGGNVSAATPTSIMTSIPASTVARILQSGNSDTISTGYVSDFDPDQDLFIDDALLGSSVSLWSNN